MTTEKQIGSRTYIIGKMSAETQFNVLRRITPLFKPIMEAIKSGVGVGPELFVTISQELSEIPDDQVAYVFRECKNVVSVQVEGGSPLKLVVNGRDMFADIDLPTLMQIVVTVIMENLRPFFQGLPAGPSNGGGQTSPTS